MFTRLKARVWQFIFNAAKAAVDQALLEDSYNLGNQINRISSHDAARYVLANIPIHKIFADRFALMDHCVNLIPPDGLVLEFGVYKGESVRHIASRLPGRRIFGFDTFEGLPESWSFIQKGGFGDMDRLPSVPENVTLIKGLFQETASDFLANHPGKIALIHMDCDLYSACKYVLEVYGHRIHPQSIIVFDEFLNYPHWMEDGEFKAFHEWCETTGAKFEFLGFASRTGAGRPCQVAVKILGLAGRPHCDEGSRQ